MNIEIKSIRPFIGAKDYEVSRQFYNAVGFEEIRISNNMSLFKSGNFGFYLQDAYIKQWINNSMLFLEVENLETYLKNIKSLAMEKTYKNVKITEIHYNDWGKEFFMYDPSGILWHIGNFKSE